MPAMPAIESDGIASQKTAHDRGNGNRPGLQQQVKMIRDQRPGQAFGGCFGAKGRQAADEIVSIDIVLKDRTALDATTNKYVYPGSSSKLSSAWVKFFMEFFQSVLVDMGVDLGGGDV